MAFKKKKKRDIGNAFTFKDYWGILVILSLLGYFIYKVAWYAHNNNVLDKGNTVKVKAVIIDERNYYGKRNGMSRYSYYYMFNVKGIAYKGDSHTDTLNVGDSLLIEYSPEHPNYSRRIEGNK
jgi:hypothetical protein